MYKGISLNCINLVCCSSVLVQVVSTQQVRMASGSNHSYFCERTSGNDRSKNTEILYAYGLLKSNRNSFDKHEDLVKSGKEKCIQILSNAISNPIGPHLGDKYMQDLIKSSTGKDCLPKSKTINNLEGIKKVASNLEHIVEQKNKRIPQKENSSSLSEITKPIMNVPKPLKRIEEERSNSVITRKLFFMGSGSRYKKLK